VPRRRHRPPPARGARPDAQRRRQVHGVRGSPAAVQAVVHISMDRHVRAENYGATLWLCTETSSLSAQSSTVYIGGDRVGVCRARTQRHPVEGLPRDPASQTRPVSRPLASTPRALCGRLLRRARGPTAARLTTASTTRLVRRREDLTGRPHQRGRLLRARHLLRGRRDGATLFAEDHSVGNYYRSFPSTPPAQRAGGYCVRATC